MKPCHCLLCRAAPWLAGLALALPSLVFALLVACAPKPEPTPMERAAAHAALLGWREAALPEPDLNGCEVERFYLRLASAEEYLRDCGAPPEIHDGCLLWTSSNHFFRPKRWPVIVISPRHRSEPHIIIHELMHAMIRCAMVGPSAWDPGDAKHQDPRVWTATGGAESAQGRALALIAREAS